MTARDDDRVAKAIEALTSSNLKIVSAIAAAADKTTKELDEIKKSLWAIDPR